MKDIKIKSVFHTFVFPLFVGAGIMWMFQQSVVNQLRSELDYMQFETRQIQMQQEFQHIEEDLHRKLEDMHNQIRHIHEQFRIEKESSARDLELYNQAARRMADELQSRADDR